MHFKRIKHWAHHTNILSFVGLVGVSTKESKKARLWGSLFNYIVVIISITLLLQWQTELTRDLDFVERRLINTSVWGFFVVQYMVLLYYVKNRWQFIRQNWLLPIIILCGIAVITQQREYLVLFRTVRPVLAILILAPAIQMLMRFFVDGILRTTLFAAAVIVIIFGVLGSGVDPAIHSVWDGIWWAVVTVSTVGYGDVVPSSALGRLIGVGLIIMGLGIFVVITANFLALILRKEVTEVKREEEKIELIKTTLFEVQRSQEELSLLLKTVNKRLQKIEKKSNSPEAQDE